MDTKHWPRGDKSHSIGLALLLLVSAMGMFVVLYHTRAGPGLSGDSILYIQGAKNLLAGNGYSRLLGRGEVRPVTAFPPMTSVSLALVGLPGGDMVAAGRWLNAALFAANIFLAGRLILGYTRSPLATLLGSGLLLAHKALLIAHSWVMSEGLFIFLMLLGLCALAEYLDSGRRWKLVLSAALISLAMLTRYVGLLLGPVAVLALMLNRRGGWKQRFTDVIIFSAVCLAPVGVWFGRNMLLEGNAANRSVAFHPMPQAMFGAFVDQILSWVYLTELGLKWRIRVPLFVALCAGVLVGFAFEELRERKIASAQPLRWLPWLLSFFVPAYLLLIWANTSFLDAGTSESALRRYLMPAFVASVVLFVCVLHRLAGKGRSGWGAKGVLFLAGVGLIFYYARPTIEFVRRPGYAYGYTDVLHAWQDEIALLARLDASRPLITNDPQLLYALCNRYAYVLPSTIAQQQGDTSIETEETLRAKLKAGALLVFIRGYGDETQDAIANKLMAELVELDAAPHIFVYAHPDTKP